ncbi:uncharacterized protein LOC129604203 [Betta splendens]|uniref:Uncharacterized protein LOC129604203 n=1 Tax=Betta splendens TaxID=158456 RepID=A0A9W2XV19_BETSP|nr:uncharacterized protein LOC129604203 [Betta splendens]
MNTGKSTLLSQVKEGTQLKVAQENLPVSNTRSPSNDYAYQSGPTLLEAKGDIKSPQINDSQVNNTVYSTSPKRETEGSRRQWQGGTTSNVRLPGNVELGARNPGFDQINRELKNRFDMTSTSEAHLKENETSKPISDFKQKKVVEAVKEELQRQDPTLLKATGNIKSPQINDSQVNNTVYSTSPKRETEGSRRQCQGGTTSNVRFPGNVELGARNPGFDQINRELKNRFGINSTSEAHLKENETSKPISDFKQKKLVEAVKEELQRQGPSVPPLPLLRQRSLLRPSSSSVPSKCGAPPAHLPPPVPPHTAPLIQAYGMNTGKSTLLSQVREGTQLKVAQENLPVSNTRSRLSNNYAYQSGWFVIVIIVFFIYFLLYLLPISAGK